jgi:hypothetical protein
MGDRIAQADDASGPRGIIRAGPTKTATTTTTSNAALSSSALKQPLGGVSGSSASWRLDGAVDSYSGCDGVCAGLDAFWVRHGLLFPSAEREAAFFNYLTTSTFLSSVLLNAMGVVLLLAAALSVKALVNFVSDDNLVKQRFSWLDQQALGLARTEQFLTVVLFAAQIVSLGLAGFGAFIAKHRRSLWTATFVASIVWESAFFVQSQLRDFSVSIYFGPTFPFESWLYTDNTSSSSSSSPSSTLSTSSSLSFSSFSLQAQQQQDYILSNPACQLNGTDGRLELFNGCSFNVTTTSAAMLYSGFMASGDWISEQLFVPWGLMTLAGSNNLIIQARHFSWVVIPLVITMVTAIMAFQSPNVNFNFGG